MLFTVLLGLAAAVDMHQKVTPVQKVPATEHGLIPFDRTEEEGFQNLESLRLWLMSEGVRYLRPLIRTTDNRVWECSR